MSYLKSSLLLSAAMMSLVASAHATESQPALKVAPEASAATRYHVQLPWKQLTDSRAVRMGQQLRCERGCSVTAADGTELELEAGAVVIPDSPRFERLDATPGSMAVRCQTLRVLVGTVHVLRPNALTTPLLVLTPNAAPLAVLGSRARVRANPASTAIAADDAVAVRRRAGWRTLATGMTFQVARDGSTEAKPTVTRAEWRDSGDYQRPIGLAALNPAADVASSWRNVPGAAHYRVVITDNAPDRNVVARLGLPASQPLFRATLNEGRYWAQVTAIDEHGIEAPASSWRALRVVRVALPPGAFMPDVETLVIPEGGSVRLLSHTGLEMSVDKSGFWPAPDRLGGPAARGQRLRLRVAGDASTTTELRVERRALKADVTLSAPTPITTAAQTIAARVELADPSGRVDLDTVVPTMEVRLGGALLSAVWLRDGDVWRARIHGRSVAGPSLLEVVARDQAGTALGRAYVEVLGAGRD